MPSNITNDAVLNGLITCDQCNAGMVLKQDEAIDRLYFTCTRPNARGSTSCMTPDLAADKLDKLVFETVIKTIITKNHVNTLIARTDQMAASKLDKYRDFPLAQELLQLSRSDIQTIVTSHSYMLKAARGPSALRHILTELIDDIRIAPRESHRPLQKPTAQRQPTTRRTRTDYPTHNGYTYTTMRKFSGHQSRSTRDEFHWVLGQPAYPARAEVHPLQQILKPGIFEVAPHRRGFTIAKGVLLPTANKVAPHSRGSPHVTRGASTTTKDCPLRTGYTMVHNTTCRKEHNLPPHRQGSTPTLSGWTDCILRLPYTGGSLRSSQEPLEKMRPHVPNPGVQPTLPNQILASSPFTLG